jgi:hypothetical protein
MEHGALPALEAWANFYVIVGSSAGALTGLQFVVIVLSAEMGMLQSDATTRAFGTPTIVHFCVVLLVASLVCAPWRSLAPVGAGLGACGVGGCVYAIVVVVRARRQTGYTPVLADWIWHGVLPLCAYAALAASAFALRAGAPAPLFGVGAAVLVLLFIGIHNSWDSVTFIAHHARKRRD